MKLIGLARLHEFCIAHADCRKWVENWIADVRSSSWATPASIRTKYPSCSFLASNVVMFNVRGNEYRLETQIAYQTGVVAIRWIGTHAEYTKRFK